MTSIPTSAAKFDSAARSHIGHVRSRNEDSYLENADLGLWLVADGVGGNTHGDFASQVVTQTVERKIKSGSTLKDAIVSAHLALIKLARENLEMKGMASTVVAVKFEEARYQIAWVGDSRAYLITKNNAIRQLTKDHNQAQFLVDTGELTIEEARTHPTQCVLMQAMGADDEGWHVDQVDGVFEQGDFLLLCSDGLTGDLQEPELLESIKSGKLLSIIVDELIDKALVKGGGDNITVALISLNQGDAHSASSLSGKNLEGNECGLPDMTSVSLPTLKHLIWGSLMALIVVIMTMFVL